MTAAHLSQKDRLRGRNSRLLTSPNVAGSPHPQVSVMALHIFLQGSPRLAVWIILGTASCRATTGVAFFNATDDIMGCVTTAAIKSVRLTPKSRRRNPCQDIHDREFPFDRLVGNTKRPIITSTNELKFVFLSYGYSFLLFFFRFAFSFQNGQRC